MNRFTAVIVDLFVFLLGGYWVASLLGLDFLLSPNLPTGGDSASHLFYLWSYSESFLQTTWVTHWMPEVFAGFAFLSYYFPLPFMVIAGLSKLFPLAPTIKIGMFAAAMLLPGLAWLGTVYILRIPRSIAIWGMLGSLGFLLHEQNSIWGGNLLSTLAGEFTQSYGFALSLISLMLWYRTVQTGRGWHWAALAEAATGFSNGFSLLITGFATAAFLFDRIHWKRNFFLLLRGHALAFFLLAGWLWPMLEMHKLTIPNDAFFEIQSWKELIPFPVAIELVAGVCALLLHAVMSLVAPLNARLPLDAHGRQALKCAYFMLSTAGLGAVGFLAGSAIGIANIRMFPFVWLFGGIACGLLFGSLLWRLSQHFKGLMRWGWGLMGWGAGIAFMTALTFNISLAMDWALWNHSGLQAKPQWHQLSKLFPVLTGALDSPRLLFEHDPANNDVGSTRTLEALPMFLNRRPVLEGLFMESAPLGPVIYQLQSEVSRHPSSPLARFPSGALDLDRAAVHMRFLWSNQVLVRNPETFQKLSQHPEFRLEKTAYPFSVFSVRNFSTRLVDLVDVPLVQKPAKQWMEDSFLWFNSRQRFGQELPVYGVVNSTTLPAQAADQVKVKNIALSRHDIRWNTDAIGVPHLVRMTWHPRWKLKTQGQLLLAAPGFMLVIPQESSVHLSYEDTFIGVLGIASTVLALLIWGVVSLRARRSKTATTTMGAWPDVSDAFKKSAGVSLLWPVLLLIIGTWFHLQNPERFYARAWDAFRANEFASAAVDFDQAVALRRSPAKQEEALFWAAKAYERAQNRDNAIARYVGLAESYHGYWLPETLFTLAELHRQKGDTTQAEMYAKRLLEEFPGNGWAQKLKSVGTR